MLDAAAVALRLLDYFGAIAPLPDPWVAAFVGLHDIGKADPLFQKKDATLAARLPAEYTADCQMEHVRGFRHEMRSGDVLNELIANSAIDRTGIFRTAARATEGHHAHARDPRIHFAEARFYPKRAGLWNPVRLAAARRVFDALGVAELTPESGYHADVTGVRLLGMTVVSDWIASNPRLFATPLRDNVSPDEYFLAARDAADRAIRRIGFVRPSGYGVRMGWPEHWPEKHPRGIQPLVAGIVDNEVAPGLAVIEAPTGEGKTEAAIHLAEEWVRRRGLAGIYVALPTQATSNQMHARFREFLARTHPGSSPLLVHGSAWLIDERAELSQPEEIDAGASAVLRSGEQDEAERWFHNLRRALLAPYAVGTIDQILLAGLGVRFGVLRLLGLSNKVLVIDEVHACDTYMLARLKRVLAWCRVLGTPVVMLSATLPRSQTQSLIAAYLGTASGGIELAPKDKYPLLTTVSDDGAVHYHAMPVGFKPSAERTIDLHFREIELADTAQIRPLAEAALASIASGGCAVVILNTVASTQALFREVSRIAPGDLWTGLFHSRYPAWRRQEIEAEVLGRFGKEVVANYPRPGRGLLIATQVVEQSLDLDFDVMFSEIAPVDLLLQRAGRLWRHEGRERVTAAPVLRVLVPAESSLDFGKSERIYERLHLLRTLGVIRERRKFQLPRDFRSLIEEVFENPLAAIDGIPHEAIVAAAKITEQHDERDAEKARDQLIDLPDAEEFRYPAVNAMLEPDDSDSGNRLRAQTRLGSITAQIFAIRNDVEAELAFGAGKPMGERLRKLFLTKVSVPVYWLPKDQQLLGSPVRGVRPLDLRGGDGYIRYDNQLGMFALSDPDDID